MQLSVTMISVLLLFFMVSVVTQECINDCFSLKDTFEECNNGVIVNESTTNGINLTFTYMLHGPSNLIHNYMAHILALICSNEDISNSVQRSFCYIIESTSEVVCPSNCPNTTCLTVTAKLSNMDSELDYTRIAELLLGKDSLLALRLADVPLLKASTVTATDQYNLLDDVPITSWVLVGLGVLTSTLTLMKPVWWDRCIKRIWKK